jgi:hypothetical protein
MESLRRFAAILLADLRERTRTVRFRVVLAGVCAAAWWSFPARDAGYLTVSFGNGLRGAYSSAWIGMVLALFFGVMLSLVGFYLVRGTVVRDFETRAWQLLVATPMTRAGFLLAKWASHMAVFGAILLCGMAVGLVAQLVRGEDRAIDLWEMAKPIALIAVPGLSLTAMFAVLFDVVPWLRRTGGNVLYFFVWIFLLSLTVANRYPGEASAPRPSGFSDPAGTAVILRDMQRQLPADVVATQTIGLNVGVNVSARQVVRVFAWKRWSMRSGDYAGRALWVVVALAGTVLAAPFLDRAAAHAGRAGAGGPGGGLRLRWLDALLRPMQRSRLGTLAAAELRGVLRARRRLSWLALLGVIALQAFGEGTTLAAGVLGGWLLSLDAFARLLLRERDHGTGALVFTAPGATTQLLAARALVALVLAWGATWPAMVRMATAQPDVALAIALAGASFAIAGLAFAAVCRNPRPFELVAVGAAYASLQGAPILNVLAAPRATLAIHAVLLPAFIVLAIVAWPRMRPVR